jgi:hypothetical protein
VVIQMSKELKLARGMRLFDNPILDWMSRIHPILPALVWGTLSLGSIVGGFAHGVTWLHALWMLAAGYLLWNFAEYGLHRFVFHWRPRYKLLRRIYYYVHEHHHRYQEWDRLLAPPLMSLPLFALISGVTYLTMGMVLPLGPMCMIMAGFGIGYLVYDYTHLYIHFAKPKTRWGRFLRRCHLQHHFVRPDRWFGISCPWMDYLLGTHLPAGEALVEPDAAEHDPDAYTDDELPPKVQEFERARRQQSLREEACG